MLKVYLSTRRRDGSNFGYLSAKILIIGTNERVKIYNFYAQICQCFFTYLK